jgi:hypothetical protein
MDDVQVFYKIPDRFPHWPKIDPPFPTLQGEMFAKIVSHPPLGQSTVIPHEAQSVTFRVALEVNAKSEKSWEVLLWHNVRGEWKEDALIQVHEHQNIVRVSHRYYHFLLIAISSASNPTKTTQGYCFSR